MSQSQSPFGQYPSSPAPALPPIPAGGPQRIQPIGYASPGWGANPVSGVWRDGAMVVLDRRATLPPMCFRCGGPPAGAPLKVNLTWVPKWIYLLLFTGVIPLVIVYLIVRKQATIYPYLCDRHRAQRKLWNGLLIASALTMFGSFFAAAVVSSGSTNDSLSSILVVAGLCGLGLLLIVAVARAAIMPTLVPTSIDLNHVHFKGVSSMYLNQLPDVNLAREQYMQQAYGATNVPSPYQ